MIHDLLSGAAFMMNIFDQISKFKANAWSTFLNKIYMSKANKTSFVVIKPEFNPSIGIKSISVYY